MNSADPPEFRVRWYLARWWSKSFLWWQCTIVSSINGNSTFHFSPSYDIETGLIYALQVCVAACDDHSNVGPGSCGIKTNGSLAWTLLVKNWTPSDERRNVSQTLLALYEFFLQKVREAGHQYMWFLQVSAPLQKPISISWSNPVLWLFRKCIEQPERSFAVGKIWISGCCRTIGSFERCPCSSSKELEIWCCGENWQQILVN